MEKMTDVELQIMDCIWSIGTDVSPSQVLTLLNERFQRGWTLQTLSTYMLRMAGKGYLTYQRKGRVSVYHPLITKDAYFEQTDRKSTRLNSSHRSQSRMPSSA